MVQVRKRRVEFFSDLPALQRTRGRVYSHFCHRLCDIDRARLALEFWFAVNEGLDFVFDQRDIGFERVKRQSKFDKLTSRQYASIYDLYKPTFFCSINLLFGQS